MNPTDPLELLSFNERLLDIMPQYTGISLTVKCQEMTLPKNLKEHSDKKFEKTLNKYQAIIEEMEYRGKDISYFKNYAKKYFISAIGHDSKSFFKLDEFDTPKGTRYRLHNNPFVSFGKVNGATLETNTTSGNLGSYGGSTTLRSFLVTGVAGQYYDQIAVDVSTANSSDLVLGSYDDTGATYPNNLKGSVGSFTAVNSDYSWHGFTEYSLTTNSTWLCYIASVATFTPFAQAGGSAYYITCTANTLPNPAAGGGTSDTNQARMKIGHS